MLFRSPMVDILGSIDDKIENNEKLCNEIIAYRQSLYRKIFIDGVESDWKKIRLSQIMDYAGGSQPPAKDFILEPRDGYIRFLQIRDYESDSHITYIPISPKNKLCNITDILIARYGASLGRICSGKKGAYNVALAKIIPHKEIYAEFIRAFVSTPEFYYGLNSTGGRSAQAGFNQGDIDAFEFYFPQSDGLLAEFSDVATTLYKKLLMCANEKRKLTEIKQLYLKKFFG